MNITTHYTGVGTGRLYESDPLDMALCEVCGGLLDDGRETDAGVCDRCADTPIEPTEAGRAFVAPLPILYGMTPYPVVLVRFCACGAVLSPEEETAGRCAACQPQPYRYPTLAERLAESLRDDRRA